MHRRQFLKSTACISATAILFPRDLLGATGAEPYQRLEQLYLSDFANEQHEAPILLNNGKRAWLTALRRRDFPAESESIPVFVAAGGKWTETTAAIADGHYEALTADCARAGEPIIAWTAIEGGRWLIKVAMHDQGKFSAPVTVSDSGQRGINPVVKAIGPREYILAWEVFADGRASIWMARYDGQWSRPMQVGDPRTSCFEPAIETGPSGELFLAYTACEGVHRNIHLALLDPHSLHTTRTIPVALGGGLKDRVNINARPALACDRAGRLWITWENNRFTTRLEDSDNYTGERCCAMVCYTGGGLVEQKSVGRWLFQGRNDHWPTFCKDPAGNLFVVTHCGGDRIGHPFWSFRVSSLDPATGWSSPTVLLETKQKGDLQRPTIIFAADGKSFWFAWKKEETKLCSCCPDPSAATAKPAEMIQARRGMLTLELFSAPRLSEDPRKLDLVNTVVEEYHAVDGFRPLISGRLRQPRATVTYQGEIYTLLRGNLHEHTNNSNCWPAGNDGTLDDDFRYGMFSEGYDFAGITDHGYSLTETYWRKSLRMAEFYNDPEHFVALPSIEWTLSNKGRPEIGRGVGHRNIFFADVHEAAKFVRNRDQVYSEENPETANAEMLWALLRREKIDCVSIPHHPADEVHPCCWETRDEDLEPVVEIFQCRGNAEYRGAPRMLNVSRHHPLANNDKGFVAYALREKKYRLGFVASGDHNNLGVGLACVWVKEVSRRGILEALRARRCFATTGDQMVIDFRVNGVWAGGLVAAGPRPTTTFSVTGMDDITRVEILRDSEVVHIHEPQNPTKEATGNWIDSTAEPLRDGSYYYLRVTQRNNHLGWSSPVWLRA